MDDLEGLILSSEDWLTDRVVHYAQLNGHTAFTSTLREAWRASVARLSVPVVAALADMTRHRRPRTEALDRAASYCLEQAQQHRALGVDLGMFLGLLVFYRRSFLDLVEEKQRPAKDRRRMLFVLMEIFDAIELRLVGDIVASKSSTEHERLKARNRELVNEKNKYLTVFESLAEPTILLDEFDAPVLMNTAGHRSLLGDDTPGHGYYGKPDMAHLRRILAPVLARVAHDAEVDAGEDAIMIATVDGPRLFSIASQTLLDISGKFTGRVIILNDVTDYLAAVEATKNAERAKAALLSLLSHETRTPINSILALTHLMDNDSLAPDQRRHILRLRESGWVLSELVENILGLSLAEARAIRRLDQDFELADLVSGVMLTTEPTARAKDLQVGFDIAPDVPGLLHGDVQKLRHILVNLLSNAVKFTSRGEVGLSVSLADIQADGQCRLRFDVSDTGPGLPLDSADWLFESFTQYVHSGVDEGQRGAGLGLSICRKFVDFLGGSISARSRPDGGSVFTFELPFMRVARPHDTCTGNSGLAVLVVEDDRANAYLTTAYLDRLGHLPVIAEGVDAARKRLQDTPFDLVISDYWLADGTGIDLARNLRNAADARLKALPLILITADVTVVTDNPPGMVQYMISKPFERQELAQAIRQVLQAGAEAGHAADTPPTRRRHLAGPARMLLTALSTRSGWNRCSPIWGRIVASALSTATSPRRSALRPSCHATPLRAISPRLAILRTSWSARPMSSA